MIHPLSIGLSLVLGSLSSASQSPVPDEPVPPPLYDYSVLVMDDALENVGGAEVRVEHLNGSEAFRANSLGRAGWWQTAGNEVARVTILEGKSPLGGTNLGQVYWDFLEPAQTAGHGVTRTFYTTIPHLAPYLITSEENRPATGPNALWAVHIAHGYVDNFKDVVEIGALLSPREIEGMEEYNNVSFPIGMHRRGFVFHREKEMSLLDGGLVLEIDCSGLNFSSQPDITTVSLVEDATVPPGKKFEAEFLEWRQNNGRALVWLKGALADGHNILLLSEPDTAAGGCHLMESHPESFDSVPGTAMAPFTGPRTERLPAASFGAAWSSNQTPEDCEPTLPAPSGGDSCEPDPPSNGATHLGTECHSENSWVAEKSCGSEGYSPSQEHTDQWDVSISIEAEIGGVEVDVGGSWSDAKTTIVQNQFGPGQGCGECVRRYKTFTACTARWEYTWRGFKLVWAESSQGWEIPLPVWSSSWKETTTTKCTKESEVSQSDPCPRTNCP